MEIGIFEGGSQDVAGTGLCCIGKMAVWTFFTASTQWKRQFGPGPGH